MEDPSHRAASLSTRSSIYNIASSALYHIIEVYVIVGPRFMCGSFHSKLLEGVKVKL